MLWLVRVAFLIFSTLRLPDINPMLAVENVGVAIIVETDNYPAELLVSLAWAESRFDPSVKTKKVCGPLQVVPRSPDDCQGLMNGFAAGVAELQELARDRRTHGDLELVLLYRALLGCAARCIAHERSGCTTSDL
jgi:hypothetical protein